MDIAVISATAILTTYAMIKACRCLWLKIHNNFIKNVANFETATGFEQLGFDTAQECHEKLVEPLLELVNANMHQIEKECKAFFCYRKSGLVTWVTISFEDDFKVINHSYRNQYFNSAVLKEEFLSGHETAEACYRVIYVYDGKRRELVFGEPHMLCDYEDKMRRRINFDLTAFPFSIEIWRNKSSLPDSLIMARKENMSEFERVSVEHPALIGMAERYGQDSELVAPHYTYFSGRIVSLSDMSEICDGYGFMVVTVKSQCFHINAIVKTDSLRKTPKVGQYADVYGYLTGTVREKEFLDL
jgi:hypothetical protein